MLYTLHFFSSKCRLFHNATLFGFCITHILNTECAKIWKKKSVTKRLKKMFIRRAKPIRIIADLDNQLPDKWSSNVHTRESLKWESTGIVKFYHSDKDQVVTVDATKAYWVDVKLLPFLTLALGGGECSAWHSGCLSPRNPLNWTLGGPQRWTVRCRIQ